MAAFLHFSPSPINKPRHLAIVDAFSAPPDMIMVNYFTQLAI
jgi:hypothetical protein